MDVGLIALNLFLTSLYTFFCRIALNFFFLTCLYTFFHDKHKVRGRR